MGKGLVVLDSSFGLVKDVLKKATKKCAKSLKYLDKYAPADSKGIRSYKNSKKWGKKYDEATAKEVSEVSAVVKRYSKTISRQAPGFGNQAFFKVLDVAKRINAGTGSLGLHRYGALIEGPTISSDDDLLLDIKEEPSHPAPYAYTNQNVTMVAETGKRVVDGQTIMNDRYAYSGYAHSAGIHYVVTQKDSCDQTVGLEDLDLMASDEEALEVAEQMGRSLAQAHGVSGPNGKASHFAQELLRTASSEENFAKEVFSVASPFAAVAKSDYILFCKTYGVGASS